MISLIDDPRSGRPGQVQGNAHRRPGSRARGRRARPGLMTVQVPVADGGDGTVDAVEAAGFRRVEIGVRGPTGKPLTASFALLDGTAGIESAHACWLDAV